MARYEYGGYSKFNVAANGLSNVDGSLYGKSRFSYKKMTYDLFASADKFYYSFKGVDLSGNNRFRLMLSIDYKFGYGKKVSQRDEAERIKDSQSAISRY